MDRKGKQLVELCTNNNLLILNGRTCGDEEGSLTFINSIGKSVNDICAVSQEILSLVNEFIVEDKTWSDHLPIKLNISIQTYNKVNKNLNLLPKLSWKNSNINRYHKNLQTNLHKALNEDNEPTLDDLGNVIKESAKMKMSRNVEFTPKQPWYNLKCHTAREKMFKLLKMFKTTDTSDAKLKYLNSLKQYKDNCSSSKQSYNEKLMYTVNNVTNSKEWWKAVKEIRNHKFQISSVLSADNFKIHFENLLNPSHSSLEMSYAPNWNTDAILDREISMDELKYVLKNLKMNKAPGEDRIPYEHIVYASDDFHKQILKRYNTIFDTGIIDNTFIRTVIFPIHKKGDLYQPTNYRGIAFMNCLAKIMMGILNERLCKWVEYHQILTEYQAGFRKGYSTVDNIYNLASIVSLKLKEKKKIYAFFVDFKAAFDNVFRKSLLYKLSQMGVSNKFITLVQSIYNNTQYAVWTGEELSDYFETNSGVKQGCLLSPILFSLYINDLHEYLEGGIYIQHLNIRLLLYADDIVILADDISTMQSMISKLEMYCNTWNLKVNMDKSEMLIFRNGGRQSHNEKWTYGGQPIKVVNEYKYLGVTFTPKLKFTKHIEKRTDESKTAINATWDCLLRKREIKIGKKWDVYQAVVRSIQTYAAQVWGFSHFEEVDNLQRYFLKKILKIPNFTPNYALMLETSVENCHLYTINLHLHYIYQIMYKYHENRLPKILTKLLLQEEVFWVTEVKALAENLNVQWPNTSQEHEWKIFNSHIVYNKKIQLINENLRKKSQSMSRIYKFLDHTRGEFYFTDSFSSEEISWIFKARCGLVHLNATNFYAENEMKNCSLCNLNEEETIRHFLGVCPVMREFRIRIFQTPILTEEDTINILNGSNVNHWRKLVTYLKSGSKYREFLINEYNFTRT